MADARITQLSVTALVDYVPCLTKWAQTWTITRTDGEVKAFTSLDVPLLFRGVSHDPCGSIKATATEMSTVTGQTGTQELVGLLTELGINETDLYNGLYDGALLESWMVPFENAGGEIPFRLIAGTLGIDSHDVLEFNLEVLTDTAKLNQSSLLEIFTPDCRYAFGNDQDSRCPVDRDAIKVTGSVTVTVIPTAANNAERRIFTDSGLLTASPAIADGDFNFGQIVWTGGQNTGATSEVKDYAGGTFTLWTPTLYPIEVGDTYEAFPGCSKSASDHLRFNADLTDFGGKPHVPGNDSILQTPDAKET